MGFFQFIYSIYRIYFQCHDLGFCDGGPGILETEMPADLPTVSINGMDLRNTTRFMIAPYVMQADNGMSAPF